MAITVLLEALSLFLCDCPQQEVMSPVFSSLNTGNGPERNTARYVCVCQSVWGNNEGENSIIRPSVLNIVCVSCSLIVTRLSLKRKAGVLRQKHSTSGYNQSQTETFEVFSYFVFFMNICFT